MDTTLRQKIRQDTKYRDAMIWLLIDTFRDNIDKPLVVPKAFVEANNQYLSENNEIKRFMLDNTQHKEGAKTLLDDLFQEFLSVVTRDRLNTNIKRSSEFSKRLTAAGYKVGNYGKQNKSHVFNVVLKNEEYDEDSAQRLMRI